MVLSPNVDGNKEASYNLTASNSICVWATMVYVHAAGAGLLVAFYYQP